MITGEANRGGCSELLSANAGMKNGGPERLLAGRLGSLLTLSLWALMAAFLILSCDDDQNPVADPPDDTTTHGWVYTVPDSTGDGWTVTHLDSVGIDAGVLKLMMDSLPYGTMPDLHSMLIVRDGKLVLEEYFEEWTRDDVHMLMSCTKSVTSALAGIAIDSGYLSGVDTAAFDFYPEYDTLKNARKDSILYRHVLTMSSGLKWDQSSYPYSDPANSLIQMLQSDLPWREFVLSLRADYSPGEHFAYSDGMAMLAGDIISRATGRTFDQWAEEVLFGPLGIEHVEWGYGIDATINSGYGLHLRPRDMARFGQLYLDSGVFNGQQIVPREWAVQSTSPQIQPQSNVHYGYFWWMTTFWLGDGRSFPTTAAMGNYGQYIFLFRDLNQVVVMTMGRPSNEGWTEARWALVNFILPASAGETDL